MACIKFFASLREQLKCAEMEIHIPSNADVTWLIEHLVNQHSDWQEALQRKDLLVAVNQTLCSKQTPISNTDEIALFPPVTGG